MVGRRCGGMKRGRRDINSPLPHAQVQRCLPRTQVEGTGAALAAVHRRRRLLVAADDCIYTVLDSRVRVQSFVDVSPFFGWFRPRCATPNRAIDLWNMIRIKLKLWFDVVGRAYNYSDWNELFVITMFIFFLFHFILAMLTKKLIVC